MELRETQILRTLVGYPTVNPVGGELPCAKEIEAWARRLGLETELQPVGENRANVLVYAGSRSRSAKTLMLNGHLDVVPAEGRWEHEPFQLSSDGAGRLYGRGACDMKGGIACMMTALEQLLRENFSFGGTLLLCFVADEECDNLGVKRFLNEAPGVDACVIGEPTDLKLCIAHRGVCRHKITILGKSCHASRPDEGVNAVEKMAAFAVEVTRLNRRLQTGSHPVLPPATVAVTTFRGGEKHNVIPDRCEAVLDWRTLPEQNEPYVRGVLDGILASLSEEGKSFRYEIQTVISLDAGNLSADSPLVRSALSASQTAFGERAEVLAFPACGEQSILMKAGIPTLFFGPGNIRQAHTVDEYVREQDLPKATAFYKSIIKELLGEIPAEKGEGSDVRQN